MKAKNIIKNGPPGWKQRHEEIYCAKKIPHTVFSPLQNIPWLAKKNQDQTTAIYLGNWTK